MGATQSSLSALKQNEHLIKFASSPKVDVKNSNYWNELLSFTYPNIYRSLDETKHFEFGIIPLLETFIKHNSKTHNLSKLIKVFLNLSTQLKGTNLQDPNYKILYWQTFNSVLILRCTIKHLIQILTENNVLSHFTDAEKQNEEENLELLMSALIEIVVDVEVNDLTYALHTESINLLIVLFSVQMYLPRVATRSVIYQTIFKEKCTIHSIKFMKRLLANFIEQRPVPTYETGSLILGLMSGVWNMINLGYGRDENGSDHVLSRLSILLILILTNHCTNKMNPYREALFNCVDVHNNYESADNLVTGFKIEFQRLFDVLCHQQNEDQTTLLLYLLIHKNPQFKIYVLSRTSDLHLLVVPVLRILYTSAERSSHHIYMALIILLILSEDSLFNDAVHDIMLKNVTWYKDKHLMDISLGGLIVLVFLRTIQFNISRTIDKFLHTNLLATLANMSSHFKRLSTVVCEKIVVLFKKLTKRMNKALAGLQQTSLSNSYVDQNSTIGSDRETDIQSNCEEMMMQDISIYEEVLRMILEIINSALANQLTHNPNLIYTLLYSRQIFEPFQSHVTFQDIVMNIETVLIYFANRIEAKGKEITLSVEDVYSEIEHASLQWPADKLKKFPELIFRYVEDDQPDEFFVPYIFTLVFKNSSLFFSSQNILLFNPSRNIV